MEERLQQDIAASRLFGTSAGPARLGRFAVLRELGRGGMGVVYSAYDEDLDRRVAIKLLHAGFGRAPEARGRMLREAQAMARLSHPNVAQVHEIGELDGQIFIAMEYLHGQTLHAWLRSDTRGWRQILDMFLQAGQGLAAAHDKGLVHRDFKPENVLVGDDGQARVVDFGLASSSDGSLAVALKPSARSSRMPTSAWMDTNPQQLSGGATPPVERLTQTGTLLGTPAYMSPEQHCGRVADARSDQFSFCVALYEALYGARPFAVRGREGEDTDADWLARVCGGAVDKPPRDTKVPRRIYQALARGLAPDPAARWPGMHALLHELARDPGGLQRRWWVAAVLALGAGAVYQTSSSDVGPCHEAESRLTGVWDDARKESVGAAFVKAPRPHAAATWERTAALLDAYAAAWTVMHRESCEATHVRGEQSDEALDLRVACLERRRRDLRALTDVFVAADGQVVDNAIQAAQNLPSLDHCADLETLRTTVRPPEDPARRAAVEQLRTRLAEGRALLEAGKVREGLALVEPLIKEVETVDYAPLTAEAMYYLGRLQELADPEAAERSLYAAVRAGAAGKDDGLVAQASTRLVYVVGALRHQHESGVVLGRSAEAAVLRTGNSPSDRADLDNNLGIIAFYTGDFEQAFAHHQRALDARTIAYGPEHPAVSKSLSNLGAVLTKQARFEEAAAQLQRAIEIYERTLGSDHPLLAMALTNLGIARDKQGRYGEAIEHYRRAIAIWDRTLGPENAEATGPLTNLAIVEQHLERHDDAAEHLERALRIKERKHGPDSVAITFALNTLATTRVAQGRLAEARDLLARVIGIYERASEPEHPEVATSALNLGDIDMSEGDLAAAQARYELALAIRERAHGSNHPDVAFVLLHLSVLHRRKAEHALALAEAERALALYKAAGDPPHVDLPHALRAVAEARLELGRQADVIDLLERALALLSARNAPAVELADGQFPLARALWSDAGPRRARAVELAQAARAAYAAVWPRREASLKEVDAWLAAHGGGGGTR